MPEERRRSPRVAVDVSAKVTVGDVTLAGQVRDICRDAVLIEVQRAYPLGTQVAVETQLPKVTGVVRATGRVVRIAPGRESAEAIAVLFDDLPAETVFRIDLFVSEQESSSPA